MSSAARVIEPGEILPGSVVSLRLVTLHDCNERYVRWLADPVVNQWLETRYAEQTLDMIKGFVGGMIASPHSYLFAIVENASNEHVGNVKIGPVNAQHLVADVSYFVGERRAWGKGYGTEAVRLCTQFGFERLRLHRCQAGVYESNVSSARLLEKVGYVKELAWRKYLKAGDRWEDLIWYGAIAGEWT